MFYEEILGDLIKLKEISSREQDREDIKMLKKIRKDERS